MPHADPAGFVFLGLSVAIIAALWLINEVATYIAVEREGRRENRILHKYDNTRRERKSNTPSRRRKKINFFSGKLYGV